MENASKALIMAGSVLIALIVISLLVIFFSNLRNLAQTEEQAESEMVAAEFNKPYEVYSRDVFGSELFSIANKVNDYNKRATVDNEGYTKMELKVYFRDNLDDEFFKTGTYNAETLVKKFKQLEDKVKEIGNIEIESSNGLYTRQISKLAGMRTLDIQNLGFDSNSTTRINGRTVSYDEAVRIYNTYKNLLTTVKEKGYRCLTNEWKYDNSTGRIILMVYEYKK